MRFAVARGAPVSDDAFSARPVTPVTPVAPETSSSESRAAPVADCSGLAGASRHRVPLSAAAQYHRGELGGHMLELAFGCLRAPSD